MLDFLELEETVGRAWHRLVGGAASYPRHPSCAATLAEMQGPLAVMFRGLGGEAGVQLAGAAAKRSGHRLGWKARMGVAEERLDQPGRDDATLFLPPSIALFPDRALNEAMYRWLAAWFVVVPVANLGEADPLRRDLLALRRARTTTVAVLTTFPGLAGDHAALSAAMAAARPNRPMPALERQVEGVVMAALGAGPPPAGGLWEVVTQDAELPARAPAGYQPFLPCPLWGDAWTRAEGTGAAEAEEAPAPATNGAPETRKRFAARQKGDGDTERDPLMLNRFEKILAMAEMVEIDRPDDDEDDDPQKAADELEELALGKRKTRPSSRLKFDLDLAPEAVDATPLTAELTYPEWDWRKAAYLPAHCRVLASRASEEGERWNADDETRRLIRRVRRQFEALRPAREILRAQQDGSELDLDALVRARSDLRAGNATTDRVHLQSREQAHDVAVTLLVDVSLSTDSWSGGARVLDVEKQAALVLAHGLSACGDSHSILTFTSRRRNWVRVETVKDFDEPMSPVVERRIGALKPGYYTRIGAAVRHAAARLAGRPNRRKLLIVLTDGKPNDVDHYEGRFGVEDTRRAVREARRMGMGVFGVTIDADAKSYFPTLFGRGGYAIVTDLAALPAALPGIYRQVTR